MEVIVDDSQLSLAIGKQGGQRTPLRPNCSGWKIDIKSEEEKRQEVQGAIELLSTGAPVSILIEYGLAEATVDALVKGDIGTVEKLGSMTPELFEALEGIDENDVSLIQQAIQAVITGRNTRKKLQPQCPKRRNRRPPNPPPLRFPVKKQRLLRILPRKRRPLLRRQSRSLLLR